MGRLGALPHHVRSAALARGNRRQRSMGLCPENCQFVLRNLLQSWYRKPSAFGYGRNGNELRPRTCVCHIVPKNKRTKIQLVVVCTLLTQHSGDRGRGRWSFEATQRNPVSKTNKRNHHHHYCYYFHYYSADFLEHHLRCWI